MSNIISGIAQSQADVISRILRNTYIVEMGIIKVIKDNNIVTVEACASSSVGSIGLFNCVLVNTASSSLAVNITPEVNDRVLVLFPKDYLPSMFKLDETETQVSIGTVSYSEIGGVAILINKFQEGYNNSVTVDAGKLDIKLSYDEDQKKNLFTVSTDDKGALSIGATELSIDTGKAKIEIDSSGNVILNSGKAEITVDGVTGNVVLDAKNGKVEIKNNLTSLYDVLNGLLQTLNTTATVTTPAGAGTITPGQFIEPLTKLNLVMQ